MKINLDRLCRLAGVETSSRTLNEHAYEGASHDSHEEVEEAYEGSYVKEADEAAAEAEVDESDCMEEDDMLEIDEVMLVQELRRAKRLMKENRDRSNRRRLQESKRKKDLFESELKKIIESEVSDIMKELNLNSGWVYGKKRPQRSKRGHVHQGSYLKGIGFK